MAVVFLTDESFEEFKDFFENRPYQKEMITKDIFTLIFNDDLFTKYENVLLKKDNISGKIYATTKVYIKRHDRIT